MAQIFISHSEKDKDLRNFFSNAFAGTKVKAVFEEFEKILTGKVTSKQIGEDIENSKAVFVVLSESIEVIPHTRDWVVWETGVAKNRDIWVFEPYLQLGKISVVTPYLKHYAVFNMNDFWLGYIRRIIESYDDSHVLPTLLVTTGIGGLLGKGEGAALGALTGLAISDRSQKRPTGVGVVCLKCSSSYNVHIPQGINIFRCPICNSVLKIKM